MWLRSLRQQHSTVGYANSKIVALRRESSSGSTGWPPVNPGDVKPVSHGVSELRIEYGPGYRVYFLRDGDRLILLLIGGDKSTEDADIRTAHSVARTWHRTQGAHE